MSVYMEVKKNSFKLMDSFQSDLIKCDHELINGNPGIPFLHFTRSMGTEIVFMGGVASFPGVGVEVPYLFGRAGRAHMLRGKTTIVHYHNNANTLLCQYFDGVKLHSCGISASYDIIKQYVDSMMLKFRGVA